MVLLDNMTPDKMREAVKIRDESSSASHVLLEASGGVTMSNVRAIAKTGVDRISLGALTSNIKCIDIGLDMK